MLYRAEVFNSYEVQFVISVMYDAFNVICKSHCQAKDISSLYYLLSTLIKPMIYYKFCQCRFFVYIQFTTRQITQD